MGNTFSSYETSLPQKEHPPTETERINFAGNFPHSSSSSSPSVLVDSSRAVFDQELRILLKKFSAPTLKSFEDYLLKHFYEENVVSNGSDMYSVAEIYYGTIMRSSNERLLRFIWDPLVLLGEEGEEVNSGTTLNFLCIIYDYATLGKFEPSATKSAACRLYGHYLTSFIFFIFLNSHSGLYISVVGAI